MARKKIAPPKDLAELDQVIDRQESGRVIEIMNMDGVSPLGFGIRIAGPDSERARVARDRMMEDRLGRDDPTENLSPDEMAAEQLRFLARISIEFTAPVVMDKRSLSSTEEDFYALYARFRFIRQQVDREALSRAAFLSDSAEN